MPRGRALSRNFYVRGTVAVAKDLLGKVLIVRAGGATTAARIVETEAYRGTDPASHCRNGPTRRCAVMFGPPGVAYVYFVYGNHVMLNLVTEPEGFPGAVLIRAVEPVRGQDVMRRRRGGAPYNRLANGPGRLCQAMGITLAHNGLLLTGPVLRVLDDGFRPGRVGVSPRVGIAHGRSKPWRFFIQNNPFVSR